VVALNLADAPATLPAPGAGAVLAGAGTVRGDVVELGGHGWAILDG
jgi:cyclomaltodextrinase